MGNYDTYIFDFERLDVYQKALELVGDLLHLTRGLPREYQFSIADQLRRAGLSVLNNIAEGSGKRPGREKTQYYRTSLGSARECIPMLSVLLKEQQLSNERYRVLRGKVIHIGNMLGRLIASVA